MKKTIFAVVIVLIVIAILLEIKTEQDWKQYKVVHHCVAVDDRYLNSLKQLSSTDVNIIVLPSSDDRGYLCDDGVIYLN